MLPARLSLLLQHMIPHHLYSRLIGKLSDCRIPWVKRWCINTFIRHYGVDMSEALNPDPEAYPVFNSFFIRHLRPQARPIDNNPQTIISPVDGRISQIGAIQAHSLIQAKGYNYHLEALLGGNHEQAKLFKDGHFITLYLAPKDYHRVHMPMDGALTGMTYIPGQLYSVNPYTVTHVPNLFARNERLVCSFTTSIGPMVIILVGAMLVASIHTPWTGTILPQGKIQHWDYKAEPKVLRKGEEIGYFKLGSTVILLFGPQAIQWCTEMHITRVVKMGMKLAELKLA